MPVFKYKTFEDADKALWNFHPDAAYYKQVAALWRFANKLSPIKYPRGVFKFRSIEEANKHRDEFELAHAKRIRAERMSAPARVFEKYKNETGRSLKVVEL